MSDTADRVLGAATDVLDLAHVAPGMVRVTTLSDTYRVDARHERCECPDWEYNLDGNGRCKHLWAALDATEQVDLHLGHTLSNGHARPPDEAVATDGGVEQWTVRGTKPNGETVEQTVESRATAEEKRDNAEDVGLEDVEIIPPSGDEPATDGGAQTPEVVEVDAAPVEQSGDDASSDTLDERSVAEDPLNWVPGEFVDEIDGTQAINRKGFEVLSHFYGVDVHTELQVPPEETDHEYCRVKATAVTDDGRECEAFGSAHVDRGDDRVLLLEMADTRARKRALSIATGVGAVAVEELKSEVNHA